MTRPGISVSVILASGGYPGSYTKGKEIEIDVMSKGSTPKNPIDSTDRMNADVVVFHAGTTAKKGKLLTSGGRVLAVTAYGETLKIALDLAYSAIGNITFENMVYRRDIAHRYETRRSIILRSDSSIGLSRRT